MTTYFIYFFVFIFHHVFMIFFCLFMWDYSLLISLNFFDFLNFNSSLVLALDLQSCLFSSIVSLITSVVIAYSFYYMGDGAIMKRFYLLLVLFVFSMFILIHSFNLLFIMIGWDGLGLSSFCLIVYYGGASVQRSGLISIYLNRLGDMGLVVFIFFLMDLGYLNGGAVWVLNKSLLMILFVLSCATKSAQYPFSSWLPAAMSAPTPISSLVHSSTLVTAGIYLMIRFSPLFYWFYSSFMFSFFALFTMVFAGFIAVVERDMKKVIAMSTLSQLGLMMYMLSLGETNYCFFHLITHAIFKSLLFMSCGSLLLVSYGNQDYRFKGGSIFFSPLYSFYFCSCSLSLGGATFLSGFFSKDLCLDSVYEMELGAFFVFLFYLGCLLTLVYSIQLFMEGLSSGSYLISSLSVYTNFFYMIPHTILLIMAVILGKFLFFVFFLEEFDFSFSLMKFLGFILLLISLVVSYTNMFTFTNSTLMDYLIKIFFLDLLFGHISSKGINSLILVDSLDLTWIELISIKMSARFFNNFGENFLVYFCVGANGKIIFLFLIYSLGVSLVFISL